jgi:putative restriction endonuclease
MEPSMAAIVLESWLGSQYDDSPDYYEFPSQYLRFFEPTTRGDELHAVIYEPRGADSLGRMAYVGYARVTSPPVRTGRRSTQGRELWRVYYQSAVESFDSPVPREVLGTPLETWLEALPRGRSRNSATRGRAVRALSDADFVRILQLAGAALLNPASTGLVETLEPTEVARQRVERLVANFEREARFRREVLEAYKYRCAVTGLGLGPVSRTKPQGILDAAHIRPVRSQGPDFISNGLPLTPTLHRMFDAGLFTARYVDGQPEVLTSRLLLREMVEVPERGTSLPLKDGTRLLLPDSFGHWPNKDQLDFHARSVFVGG